MDWKRLLWGRWNWRRPIVSLLSIYLMLLVVAVFFADRLLFLPPASSYDADEPDLVWMEAADGGRLAALYFAAEPGQPTLLFSHGNAEDIGHSRELYEMWAALGLGVLAYDYPGYGLSTGRPAEAAANAAARAAWDWLRARGVAAESIVLVGRSVGSGPSVWLDGEVDAGGLVLIAPFTSVYRVAFGFAPFPRDRFPNLARIRRSGTPLLVVHGTDDEVIPFHHGRAIHDASAATVKQFLALDGVRHNDLFARDGERVVAEIARFARKTAD